jgi:hypothetical protein
MGIKDDNEEEEEDEKYIELKDKKLFAYSFTCLFLKNVCSCLVRQMCYQ